VSKSCRQAERFRRAVAAWLSATMLMPCLESVHWPLVALCYCMHRACCAMRSTNRSDRSYPVTPANNPKSGNAFSAGSRPRRCNLDLDTNRILAWTAMASRIARLHARPGPLRGARGDRGRWSSRLRVGASVRRNGDNGQGGKFHERFHRDSPIPAWLRPARNEALVALSALYQGNRLEP